ncbi:MAG: hypothetical protein PVF27_10135, partial [Gemmatimonadales bacterium]
MRVSVFWAVSFALVACEGESSAQADERARELATQLTPVVERIVGLPFKTPPVIAVRTRQQVGEYLAAKLDDDLPAQELAGMSVAYRLFRLLPDTLDLRALMLSLYTEQVVGYYDPDSAALYVVAESDPAILRLTMAHELVHALQGQYVPLNELIERTGANDEKMAAQAVLEGQATLVAFRALLSEQEFARLEGFSTTYRRALQQQFASMPVFGSAPRVIREGLVFPYLEGADFIRWFSEAYPDTVPFGPRLPRSTEQILHPDRYRGQDAPVRLATDTAGAVYSDGLGEFETRILLTELTGNESSGRAGALDWDGDRYVVRDAPGGSALVWWSVWDHERAAAKVATLLERYWLPGVAAHRRAAVERITIDGLPGVRLVDA